MATKQVAKGTMPAGRKAATLQAASALAQAATVLAQAATPAAPAPQAAAPAPTGTPLPANWLATAPSAAASVQAFAAYKLPNSLQSKGANLCGGNLPPALQNAKLLPGKPYVARSGHNAAWAATCTAMATAAAPTGGVPAAALVQAGVGAHSVAAYVKRGWLVAAK